MRPVRIVNVPDVSPGDDFVDLHAVGGRPVQWLPHSGLPANLLERTIRRPRLSRYRAAWNATEGAQHADALISHLPRMSLAVERSFALRRARVPHLAFSFNFTDFPEGRLLRGMTRAFAQVERFCMYSRYEATVYPERFGLPADRFRSMFWTQEPPATDTSAPVPDKPFVVAIGGEGRDYAGIKNAARAQPDVQWIAITRPTDAFADAPANLSVRHNVPAPVTWGMAARAAAVVVPLQSETTCCGHITIASAQLLGLPLITTHSRATVEYVEQMPGTIVVPPQDADALAAAALAAAADAQAARQAAAAARVTARQRYDRAAWTKVVAEFVRDFVS